MALRAFVTGIMAALLNSSVYAVTTEPHLFLFTIALGAIITDIAILLVLKFISAEKIRIINEHKEQQWFLIAWMSVFNIYLLFNSNVFTVNTYHPNLVGNEIIVSIAILTGLYIVVFFAFKTISLLGYKEKSAELQREVYQEQQFKSATLKDSIMTYEINITQDRLIKGFEAQESELGEMVHCYSDMLAYMIHRFIYSEDIEKFAQYGSRANLSREYEEGKSESTIEYRRLMDDCRYIWVRAITNLTRSLETGDLIAVVFIKDIEVEKQYQLNLQHKAERDPLTGLYNKEMTGKLVNEALTFHPTHTKSALFMIDADNFKEVNDQLGHFYGDAVLCELAEKLQRIFRSNDIVGRIGGDEYIAFMKEGATKSVVEKKAAEICKAFYTVYKGTDHENFILSSSIGIAIFPKDGSNFDELYHKADIALYEAKSNGKNNFVLYHGNTFNGYQSNRNTILQTGFPASKSFRNNRIEYVFKILYQSDNPFVAIQSVLELVAGHFSFERGYIFETSKDGKHLSKTFEWCASDVEPQIDLLQNIPIDMLIPNYSQFCEEGVFVMRPLEDSQINHRDFLEPLGIKLMMQFGIFDKGKLIGFIGFDNCENDLIPSELEIDEMKTICNILATFFVMRRICEAAEESLATMTKIMNYFENYIYVIDPQSFEILYVNEKLKQRMGENQENLPCYCFLMGYEEQCSDCPMKKITVSSNQKETFKKYNEKFDLLMEVEFSYLRWKNGKDVCMVSCLVIPKEN